MNESIALPKSTPNTGRVIVFGVVLAVIAIVLGLLAVGVRQRTSGALASGDAPPFELKTFDGETIRLSELRGKPVIVNFWASWCIPCRQEAPLLQQVWDKYRSQELVLIGVDYVDTEDAARAFMKEFGVTYPNGPDVGTRIAQAFHITGVPETYFITRAGKLLDGKDSTGRANGNWIGVISEAALKERIEKLLLP